MLMCELAKAMQRFCELIMQNSLLTLVGAIWHRAQGTKACSEVHESIHGVSFLVPAHIILPLFLRRQGFPCLQRLLGQDDDSHMLFTAGLEAPLKHQHIHDCTPPTRKCKSWICAPVYDKSYEIMSWISDKWEANLVSHEILHSSQTGERNRCEIQNTENTQEKWG